MSKQPSLDLYRTFAVVLREGSFSRASRVLGVQQSSVTRHIDSLELATGAQLFIRSSRGLMPTDRALALQPIVDDLLQAATALIRGVAGDEEAMSGPVRISAADLVAIHHLPAMLARLRGTHPGIICEVVASNDVDNLDGHRADIAVRMVDHIQEGLFARKCPSIKFGLYADRSYLERHGMPRFVSDLDGHDIITLESNGPSRRAIIDRIPAFGRDSVSLRTDSQPVQFAAILAGMGIGVAQVVLARRHPSLVRLLEEDFVWSLPVWIVVHQRLRTRPRCLTVFDSLVEQFSMLAET